MQQSAHHSKPQEQNQVNGGLEADTKQSQPTSENLFEVVSWEQNAQEPVAPLRTVLHTESLEEVETESYDHFLEITVTEPQKVGDGMGSYMAYKVTTKTNLPKFRKNQFSVMRRFSDFLGEKLFLFEFQNYLYYQSF